jgi:hypothetical protein
VRVTHRVSALSYAVVWLDANRRVSDDAPLVQMAVRGFDCQLRSGTLAAVPSDDYADADSARDVLEPGLRAWEAYCEVVHGLPFCFHFAGSSIQTVDEHGVAGTTKVVTQAEFAYAVDGLSVVRDSFPPPSPQVGIEGPVTSQLRARWRAMTEGRESLTACAYWLETKLETAFGPGRKASAKLLGIEFKVLDRLGELSSADDPAHGRKAGQVGRTLTDNELSWLRAVGSILIRRVMEYEASVQNLPVITMTDLSVQL